MDVMKEAQIIFREVFADDEIEISEEMTADDIPDWNSLTYIELLCAIEGHFNIKLNTREIRHFKNIGDMLAVIKKKTESCN